MSAQEFDLRVNPLLLLSVPGFETFDVRTHVFNAFYTCGQVK